MARRIVLAILLLTALTGLMPRAVQAKTSPLGSVRYIHRGLAVQPPHHRAARGKVKQKLYAAYHLATTRSQLASLSFKDGSTLHINENTDLTLRSPHATYVRKGEVDVIDNGGHHQVVTAVATVSAIGTEYDVKVIVSGGKVTVIVTVASGTVMVTSRQGSQEARAGEQVMVSPAGVISRPTTVDAAAVVAWTAPIPPPASSNPTPTTTSAPIATPTFAPSSTPVPLFNYTFSGLAARWTSPFQGTGDDGATITQATGCGTTSTAWFTMAFNIQHFGNPDSNTPATDQNFWTFSSTFPIGAHRYVDMNGAVIGAITLNLTMQNPGSSTPTVTMAPQIQGNIPGYTAVTASVPVTKTPATSCPVAIPGT